MLPKSCRGRDEARPRKPNDTTKNRYTPYILKPDAESNIDLLLSCLQQLRDVEGKKLQSSRRFNVKQWFRKRDEIHEFEQWYSNERNELWIRDAEERIERGDVRFPRKSRPVDTSQEDDIWS